MNPASAIVVFVLWWWLVFFAVLPRNVTGRWEAEAEEPVAGADPGAPTDPQLGRKAWLTTKIATVLWAATCLVIVSGVFDFRN